MSIRSICTSILALVIIVALVPAASAQVARGNIYGRVTDESGAMMPGASVTLSGAFGTQSTVTDTQGEFHFLRVDQGRHTISVSLPGFTTVTREVVVTTGANIDVAFNLKVAAFEETMVVEAETPIIDTKKVGTATTVGRDELSKIPSSRDPWALMRTIPGVLVDRVNIAGSESGQQSYFTSKGSAPKDAVWSLDGVVITDMAALGSSPVYFNYDSFEEVNFTTGGADVSQATGALGINLAPKRGTNAFHGSFNGYFTHDDLQWANLPAELVGDPRLQGSDKADHTEQIFDWSADLGGPIFKDKLWFYGSLARNDIRIKNLLQAPDKTNLKNYSAKLNWQASSSDMVSFFWFLGEKTKAGRASVAGFNQLDGTLWDQGGSYPGEPHGLTKLEWNHVFSPHFLLNAKGSYYSTGFGLEPQGGLESDKFVLDNVNRQTRGTWSASRQKRPQHALTVDGNYFKDALGGSHEVKFGVGYRDTEHQFEGPYPGHQVQARFNPTSTRARFYRDSVTDAYSDYWNAYISDTFTKTRFSMTLGLRFDRQRSKNRSSSVDANPEIPTLLPGFDYAGDTEWPITWNSLSPRAGFTYALDEGRKTLLRGSYAWYAGQLQTTAATITNPVAASYLEYDWRDRNGDEVVQNNEVDFSRLRTFSNVDPLNPGAIGETPNRIDPDLKPNRTHEFVLGLERELAPNFAASLAYTWQKSTDLTAMQTVLPSWYPWVGIDSARDYALGERECQNGYCATPYVLDSAALLRPEVTGGFYLTNRDDYSWTYNGIEASLIKRLSDKWMGRVTFAWNDVVENVGPGASVLSNPGAYPTDAKQDGGQVVQYGAGTSGKTYYFNAKWQVSANALYELPQGFEVSANLFGRQGYPNPIYLLLDAGELDGSIYVLAEDTKVDTERFPALWDLDVRLAKNFVWDKFRVTLAAEMFNVFNSNTEMNRINQANSASYGRLDEILAPRIVRFGAKVTF
jgi:hypothetical protein